MTVTEGTKRFIRLIEKFETFKCRNMENLLWWLAQITSNKKLFCYLQSDILLDKYVCTAMFGGKYLFSFVYPRQEVLQL